MVTNIPTVSQVVGSIKNCLESEFRHIEVIGEISNLSRSSAGHIYFTLSDSNSSLNCCLFKMDALRNSIANTIKNGVKIVATGSIGVYERRGSFQLIAKRINLSGVGDLALQLENLKKKLAAEGLFSDEHKSKIPRFPKRIGLITAYESAAYHDFINVVERRSHWFDIVLSEALVQGKDAPASLRKALHKLIKLHLESDESQQFDIIVITRGGGSLEDLWAFNDEGLAWDIFNCPIPIVSAVGHEINYSISDFVSDFRAETPTAAAELITEGQVQLFRRMENTRIGLINFSQKLMMKLENLLHKASPDQLLVMIREKLHGFEKKLDGLNISKRFTELIGIHNYYMQLEEFNYKLLQFSTKVEKYKNKLEGQYALLNALGPKSILGRGYTFLKVADGGLVPTAEKFKKITSRKKDQVFNIHFSDSIVPVKALSSNFKDD